MGVNALNEYGADGSRETNFRRDVRHALDMHPMDHEHQMIAEIKRLRKQDYQLKELMKKANVIDLTSLVEKVVGPRRG